MTCFGNLNWLEKTEKFCEFKLQFHCGHHFPSISGFEVKEMKQKLEGRLNIKLNSHQKVSTSIFYSAAVITYTRSLSFFDRPHFESRLRSRK